jgi:hypothetical protein
MGEQVRILPQQHDPAALRLSCTRGDDTTSPATCTRPSVIASSPAITETR